MPLCACGSEHAGTLPAASAKMGVTTGSEACVGQTLFDQSPPSKCSGHMVMLNLSILDALLWATKECFSSTQTGSPMVGDDA